MIKNKFLVALVFLVIVVSPALAQSAYGDPIDAESYTISRSFVDRELALGDIFMDSFSIENKQGSQMSVTLSTTGEISDLIEFDVAGVIIDAQNKSDIDFNIIARELGTFTGTIVVSGDINEEIPVNLTILEQSNYQKFILNIEPLKKTFTLDERIEVKINLRQILSEALQNVSFVYTLGKLNAENFQIQLSPEETESEVFVRLSPQEEVRDIEGSFQITKKFQIPEEVTEGDYVLNVVANYKNESVLASTTFTLTIPFLQIRLFGLIPVWLIITIVSVLAFGTIAFLIIRREIKKRKKYKMQLVTNTLPKKGERNLWFGKVAEKNIPAYYEMDKLTTHAVVAGATGGGKSIAAQVIIEEALLKNIAVIVFDPTAQWSGMLRKGDDKKMFSFYPKFGLKPSDARAFPGNVRQVMNERQVIDIEKYTQPGHIQIFTLNKLDPSKMDVFVASVIASIFRSDPKEHPGLKTLLVFDEVHRLLPKFGGSGEGFLQIERACREFRKWGLGVMLVSQVLSDFVGEIKANINTEVQMRTRDEADLNRLKTKYGEEVLQSLIKASVGVGMFVNPSYNRGKPYFINFRPILHNTRRLSDEVLEKYNQYGEVIEDLEYQIEQLEAEKIDTFDLKMELKLVKDKLMTGNFTVVDIYLEGLTPRFEKQWQSLGKKPKKKEIELIDAKEVEASINQAKSERAKIESGSKDKKEGSDEADKPVKEKKKSPKKEKIKKPKAKKHK